ncbi:hypothetical protein LV85_01096 [Algoriphagus chordae]|uniref:Uncharacterized protein n=1 Tax=Algoriphagus chordae TaxID=237019 RepID=A0A2W7R1W0_9BACT|nr:hypothetical protein LV85_01096 [Algoriphagus chordae]
MITYFFGRSKYLPKWPRYAKPPLSLIYAVTETAELPKEFNLATGKIPNSPNYNN